MNNGHEALLEDVAVYALGSLTAPEADRVRAHLAECAQCRNEYRALRPAADLIGLTAESATQPSRLLKARIMKTVRAQAAPRSGNTVPSVGALRAVRPIVWPAYAVAAACFAIALVTSVFNISLNQSLKQSQNEVDATTARSSSLARRMESEKQMIADLLATSSVRYPVAGGEVVKHGDRLYIAMRQLPPPPKGKVYQAWTKRAGVKAMSPSITFVPSSGGVAVVPLPESATKIVAVAVSVEPEGGSKQPTSTPTFIVKMT
ncbi:MAG: anti-sigma factor [Candidatus Eremiobacteraeota bacterium]|nr:anti-sigma factor [Candidatus Eremiobacteraeota bacterium]